MKHQQHFTAADFERHYIRYKAEGFPRGESMEGYCFRHGIPHNLFDKWYRDTRHKVVPVQIEGAPGDEGEAEPVAPGGEGAKASEKKEPRTGGCGGEVRILVSIRASNGLRISQSNLSYEGLAKLVENLEGLC